MGQGRLVTQAPGARRRRRLVEQSGGRAVAALAQPDVALGQGEPGTAALDRLPPGSPGPGSRIPW